MQVRYEDGGGDGGGEVGAEGEVAEAGEVAGEDEHPEGDTLKLLCFYSIWKRATQPSAWCGGRELTPGELRYSVSHCVPTGLLAAGTEGGERDPGQTLCTASLCHLSRMHSHSPPHHGVSACDMEAILHPARGRAASVLVPLGTGIILPAEWLTIIPTKGSRS